MTPQIHDGPSSRYHHVGRFCGTSLPGTNGTIITTHNAVYLWFRSDHNVAGYGFNFTWNATEPGVFNQVVVEHSRSNLFLSVDLSGLAVTCLISLILLVILICVMLHHHVSFALFVFRHFAVIIHFTSAHMIFSNALLLVLFIAFFWVFPDLFVLIPCCQNHPMPFHPSMPIPQHLPHTDHGTVWFSFAPLRSPTLASTNQLSLPVTVCGGDLHGLEHGSIKSPGYPGLYPVNRDCYWTVTVPMGKRIKFHFPTLQLEHHSNCSYDFLEVS